MRKIFCLIILLFTGSSFSSAQNKPAEFDVIIKNGAVYDGTGGKSFKADVGIVGDKIDAIGNLSKSQAKSVVDASGLAIAPGFINMLSWSTESLIVDPRSMRELPTRRNDAMSAKVVNGTRSTTV